MKTINYFSGSLSVLLFYALFVACNDDLQTISVTEIKGIEQTSLNESNALMSSDVVTDSTMLGKGNTISNSTSATNAFFTKQEYEEGMDGGKIEKVRYLLYTNIRYPVVIFLLDMVLILAYII